MQDLRSRTPLKTVVLRPTTRKFFEKNLTKNSHSPTARTCAGCQHRRGLSRRPKARIVLRGHPPRLVPRGHAPLGLQQPQFLFPVQNPQGGFLNALL